MEETKRYCDICRDEIEDSSQSGFAYYEKGYRKSDQLEVHVIVKKRVGVNETEILMADICTNCKTEIRTAIADIVVSKKPE